VQKRSRKGKVFYGCGNYAKTGCDYVTWDRPVAGPCPACGHPLLVRKVSRAGAQLKCPACSHAPSEEEVAAAASSPVAPNVAPAPAAPPEPNVAPPATPAEA
jgi:DNA topoisomerase-1